MNDYQSKRPPLTEVEMEVVFGTPSQNCIGSGICMVMSRLPRQQSLRCAHTPAYISCQKGKLVFRFPKSKVMHDGAIGRLDKPWFEIKEAYQMPKHIARKLGTNIGAVACGIYPIVDRGDEWVLNLSCSEQQEQ